MSSEIIGVADLSGRYAKALFELADAEKQLDLVATDLESISGMIKESDDFERMLNSPVISRENQSRAFEAVLNSSGACELTRRFGGLLSKNRRLAALPGVIAQYQNLIAQRRGEVTANVVSAKELTKAQLKALGTALKKTIGSDVTINTHVDESILGGLVVKIGSQMIDSSLKSKLQQLGLAMKGIG